jgi:hypothetical protein
VAIVARPARVGGAVCGGRAVAAIELVGGGVMDNRKGSGAAWRDAWQRVRPLQVIAAIADAVADRSAARAAVAHDAGDDAGEIGARTVEAIARGVLRGAVQAEGGGDDGKP